MPSPPRARSATRPNCSPPPTSFAGPYVLKALHLLHKSDAGGVALGLRRPGRPGRRLPRHARAARAPSYSVEAMADLSEGVELIVGVNRDPRFGPVAMVGLGGVLAEALQRRRLRAGPAPRGPRAGHCCAGCAPPRSSTECAAAPRSTSRPRHRPSSGSPRSPPPTPRSPNWRSTPCSSARTEPSPSTPAPYSAEPPPPRPPVPERHHGLPLHPRAGRPEGARRRVRPTADAGTRTSPRRPAARCPAETVGELTRAAMDAGVYAINMPDEVGRRRTLSCSTRSSSRRSSARSPTACGTSRGGPPTSWRTATSEQREKYLLPVIRAERSTPSPSPSRAPAPTPPRGQPPPPVPRAAGCSTARSGS